MSSLSLLILYLQVATHLSCTGTIPGRRLSPCCCGRCEGIKYILT